MNRLLSGDEHASRAIAEAVEAVEARTDAEIVVVIAARSDPYPEAGARLGGLLALVVGLVLLLSPVVVGEGWFALDVVAAFVLGDRLARARWITRWLTTDRRRREATLRAAREAFVTEAVHGTPNRTGLLVYVSVAEGRTELVPDLGLQGCTPPAELAAVAAALQPVDLADLVAGLAALGELLAHRVPHTPTSDATDLPNAPRIRP